MKAWWRRRGWQSWAGFDQIEADWEEGQRSRASGILYWEMLNEKEWNKETGQCKGLYEKHIGTGWRCYQWDLWVLNWIANNWRSVIGVGSGGGGELDNWSSGKPNCACGSMVGPPKKTNSGPKTKLPQERSWSNTFGLWGRGIELYWNDGGRLGQHQLFPWISQYTKSWRPAQKTEYLLSGRQIKPKGKIFPIHICRKEADLCFGHQSQIDGCHGGCDKIEPLCLWFQVPMFWPNCPPWSWWSPILQFPYSPKYHFHHRHCIVHSCLQLSRNQN